MRNAAYRTAEPNRKKKLRNKGSIRADFEELDDSSEFEEDTSKSVGPGAYLKEKHTTMFSQVKRENPSHFGSVLPRFERESIGQEHLGPGSYLSQNVRNKFEIKRAKKETQNFLSPERKPFVEEDHTMAGSPGP